MIKDTKPYWLHRVVLIIVSGFLSFFIQYLALGREFSMSEAADWLTGTLLPGLIICLLFLGWNAIRAPSKLAVEDAKETSKLRTEVQELKAQLDPRQHRKQIREALGAFLAEGIQLRDQCTNENQPPPNAAADDWAARTQEYLRANLGTEYIPRFRDHSGLPTRYSSIASEAHVRLWSGLMTRTARLQEFIRELAD